MRRSWWRQLPALLLLAFAFSAHGTSSLSRVYTAGWAAPHFFPLGTTRVHVYPVKDETGHEATFDVPGYLADRIRRRLAREGFEEGTRGPGTVDVEVRLQLYQEGSTFGRWAGEGAGIAYAVVRATFREPRRAAEAEVLTVSVIGVGGFFSAGAEKSVLDDVAETIASYLKGPGRNE